MILESGDRPALPYQVNMIRYNEIGNLLPIQFFIEDGAYHYYYDISCVQSMGKWMNQKKYKLEDLQKILTDLYKTVSRMEDFLLDINCLILLPEYVFVDKVLTCPEYHFCYYPDKEEGFEESLCHLMETILNRFDYGDDVSVQFAYELYRKIRKEHMPLGELMKLFSHQDNMSHMGSMPAYKEEDAWFSDKDKKGFSADFSDRYGYQSMKGSDKPGTWELDADTGREAETEAEAETETEGGGRIKSLLFYLPDLAGAFIIALMAVYMKQHHHEMTTREFGIWGLGLIVVVWGSSYLSSCIETHSTRRQITEPELKEKRMIGDCISKDRNPVTTDRNHVYGSVRCSMPAERMPEAPVWPDKSTSEEIEEVFEETDFRADYEPVKGGSMKGEAMKGEPVKKVPVNSEPVKCEPIPATVVMRQEVLFTGRCPVLVSDNKSSYQDIVLNQKSMVIGKVRGFADICLDQSRVSRMHAKICQNEDGCSIMDLGSTNGTYVNGSRIEERQVMKLNHGDRIAFADISYQFLQEFS